MQLRHIAPRAALALGVVVICTGEGALGAQADQAVPVSYVCTMDADVVDDKPGMCPVCKMTLQPVRIESAFSCPNHAAIIRDRTGVCPIDKRELVPVFINHFWDCGEVPEHLYASPQKCAGGKPAEERRVVRAHGDHNPRHGGQFFMASDKWHHVEGTYPREGQFRLFMYDNFTQPLELTGVIGRVFMREDNGRELDVSALKLSADGNVLEAAVAAGPFPLKMTAKIKFKPQTPEERFDFAFPGVSVEPVTTPAPALTGATRQAAFSPKPVAVAPPPSPAPRLAAAPPSPAPTPASAETSPAPAAAAPPAATIGVAPNAAAPAQSLSRTEAEQLIQDLPRNTADLLKLLDLRAQEIKTLVDDGSFGMVWVPTMLAKEVALALGDHASELPERQQASLSNAVRRLVLSAWRLDQYGDLGDREKITGAHNTFAAAAAEIKAAYGNR